MREPWSPSVPANEHTATLLLEDSVTASPKYQFIGRTNLKAVVRQIKWMFSKYPVFVLSDRFPADWHRRGVSSSFFAFFLILLTLTDETSYHFPTSECTFAQNKDCGLCSLSLTLELCTERISSWPVWTGGTFTVTTNSYDVHMCMWALCSERF